MDFKINDLQQMPQLRVGWASPSFTGDWVSGMGVGNDAVDVSSPCDSPSGYLFGYGGIGRIIASSMMMRATAINAVKMNRRATVCRTIPLFCAESHGHCPITLLAVWMSPWVELPRQLKQSRRHKQRRWMVKMSMWATNTRAIWGIIPRLRTLILNSTSGRRREHCWPQW